MAYDPPSGSAVNFDLSGPYTPPDGGHIDLDLGSGVNVSPDELVILIEPESCLVTIGEPVNILPDELQILMDMEQAEVTVSHYLFPDELGLVIEPEGAICGVLPDELGIDLSFYQVQISQTHMILPDEFVISVESPGSEVIPLPEYARPSKLSTGGLSLKFSKAADAQPLIRAKFGAMEEQSRKEMVSWAKGHDQAAVADCAWSSRSVKESGSALAWSSCIDLSDEILSAFSQMEKIDGHTGFEWQDLWKNDSVIASSYRSPGEIDGLKSSSWGEFGHLDEVIEADYSYPPELDEKHETRWGRKYYERICLRKYEPPSGGNINFNIDMPLRLVGDGDHIDAYFTKFSYDERCTHREPSGWRENYTYKRPKAIPRPPVLGVYIVLNNAMLCRLPDRTPVGVLSMSLSSKIDSWCWDFKAVLESAADLALVKSADGTPVPVEVEINGWKWVVMIEDSEGSRQFPKGSWSVSGRSLSAELASPYAPIKTYTESNQRLARQLAEAELENTGWSFDWQLEDWLVPGNVLSVSNQTPMETIQKIIRAVGGEIQSHRTDKVLKAISRYPKSPWIWETETPVISLHESVIMTLGWSNDRKPGYNGIYVSGSTAGGVTVFVRRDGTAGDNQAQMIVEPLITAVEAGRERGRVELCKAGKWSRQRLSLPLMAGTELPGLLNCGDLIEVQEGAVLWRGQVSDVAINATRQNGLKVYQNIEVERYHG